MYSLTP
jgi:hypothetical protein